MNRSLLLIVTAGLCLATPPAAGPEAAAMTFFQHYQSMKLTGLPSDKEIRQLAPWLSNGLRKTIAAARAEQARCMKAFKDEKPPWIEGDLFTSNFEGFTTFQVNKTEAASTRLTLQFEYVENGQKFAWKDDVEMVREGGSWKLNDIFFRQSAKPDQSLRGGLTGPGCGR